MIPAPHSATVVKPLSLSAFVSRPPCDFPVGSAAYQGLLRESLFEPLAHVVTRTKRSDFTGIDEDGDAEYDEVNIFHDGPATEGWLDEGNETTTVVGAFPTAEDAEDYAEYLRSKAK